MGKKWPTKDLIGHGRAANGNPVARTARWEADAAIRYHRCR
jgi:hypothetical protein